MRHHYIPCFYTSRWVGQDKRLCQYSRPFTKVKAKRVYPAGTGYVDDLWAIPHVEEGQKQLIETRFMSAIDQKASDALSKIENNNINLLTPEERTFWATFLISLTQRHPDKFAKLRNDALADLDNITSGLRSTYDSRKKPDDPATFSEWLQKKKNQGFFEKAGVMSIQSAIALPKTTSVICNFHWGVCTFNENSHRLLTSDRPVIMSDGLKQPDAYIALPIGPRKLFFASRAPEMGHGLCRMRNFAERSNDLIAREAFEYVYGTDDSQLRFVENRLRKKVA
jgi:hypothetical protein